MDLFTKHSVRRLDKNDLHLIGVCSIFIATKTEDIYMIEMKDIISKLGANKYSRYLVRRYTDYILIIIIIITLSLP
jgi:cyclin B